MTTNLKKKAKTEGSDFDILRQYILECPRLSRDNAAVKAALSGLDQELNRRERDAKLQRKFANSCGVDGSSTANPATNTGSGRNANTSSNKSASATDDDLMKEWQDVGGDDSTTSTSNNQKPSAALSESVETLDDEVEIIDVNGTMSVLGKNLASIVIATIAEFNAKAKSPLAAIAMALHAAMRSKVLGFACTGIPDGAKGGGGGFAPPIRELPKTQFLPKGWDQNAATGTSVTLRYRKNGVGSIHLKVEQQQEQQQQGPHHQQVSVKIQIIPANSQEPCNESLLFPLDQHINLDSWNAALRVDASSSSLPPALHYKGLSVLLTNFTKTFDLGHVNEDATTTAADTDAILAASGKHTIPTMGADTTIPPAAPPLVGFAQPCNLPHRETQPWNTQPPMVTTSFFPNTNIPRPGPPHPGLNPGGDFAGDLAPGGLTNPLIFNNGPSLGNAMGPNHPMFAGVNRIGGNPGEGGMPRPRFDPFGPPGGPQEINPNFPGRGNRLGGNNNNNRQPPGGFGEPDNDMMRPPDNDMMYS